jgi:pyruvate dehydrogenase E1 component
MGEGRGGGRSWIATQLPKTGTPVIAASDYVRAVPDLIRPWIADKYMTLGTDGFGRSDTRANLRRFFGVDRHSVALAALSALGDGRVEEAAGRYGIDTKSAPPWTR